MGLKYRSDPPPLLSTVPLTEEAYRKWIIHACEYEDWKEMVALKTKPPDMPQEEWQEKINSAYDYGQCTVIMNNISHNPILAPLIMLFGWFLADNADRRGQIKRHNQIVEACKDFLPHSLRTIKHKKNLRRRHMEDEPKCDTNTGFADSNEDLTSLDLKTMDQLLAILDYKDSTKSMLRGRLRWLLSLNDEERLERIKEAKAFRTYLKNQKDYNSYDEFKESMQILNEQFKKNNITMKTREDLEEEDLEKMEKKGLFNIPELEAEDE